MQDLNPAADPAVLATKQRLLDAAGEVFAEVGFRAATIRDICRRADNANVASVNYHFGGKEQLYTAVIRYAHGCARGSHAYEQVSADLSPEEQLREFVRSFMLRMHDAGRPAWEAKLMSREMFEPTCALGAVVEDGIRPQFNYLMSLVARILGAEVQPAVLRQYVNSVVGQCLFYRQAQPVLRHLEPDLSYTRESILALADHVAEFSLAAMHAARDRLARQAQPKPVNTP